MNSSTVDRQTEQVLENLLMAWEEVYEQGQNLPAEELCADHPELAAELQRRINALLRMEKRFGATGGMESAASQPPPEPELTGPVSLSSMYSVLRPHAEGGLGEVYLAHDSCLQREVALKTLKAICEKYPDRKDRFLREARVTGQLEHPGIVPVYGLGTTRDGKPVYAMRFIRGESLDEEILEAHSRGLKPAMLRKLLRHLVSACRTVHYAHTRRVLHCDLKPMNIMVGKFGETFVLDWGEALVINPHTLATEGPVPAATDIERSTDSPAGGTVPYMAPERLDGEGAALDPTSDVYSLGATLYKILTGRDAFRSTNRHELVDKILRNDYPSPRQINPGISRTLSEIVAKAMSVRRDHRYSSAGQLADDIQAWMDDEPVSVRHESWTEWVGRISRRHRAAAMATLATLLVVIAGTTALAVMSMRNANQRARDLEIVEAARENGLMALARFAALQMERDTETTWKTMEQAAADPRLPEWIRQVRQEQTLSEEVQQWLAQLYTSHRENLNASSWFIMAANGDQLGRFPEGKFTLEDIRNFAHKSYFHGEEVEYSEGTIRDPIRQPRVSAVFWSSSDKCRKIAYSVPIWDASSGSSSPVGVLVMTVKLGDIRLLDINVGSHSDRQAILVDMRTDWTEQRGSVLQHPLFREDHLDPNRAPRIDEDYIDLFYELAESEPDKAALPFLCREFRDPIVQEPKLAAVAPVRVRGDRTGWYVLVVESQMLPDHD